MEFMLSKRFLTAFLVLPGAVLLGAAKTGATTTVYTLSVSGAAGDVFDGVDGWSQSEANFSSEYPRSYVQPFSGGVTGFSVGGFYDTEPFTGGNSMSVFRSVGVHDARGAGLEVAFQLQDSEVLADPGNPGGGYFDTDRNQFSLGFQDLVSVVFQPSGQSADPSSDTAAWNPFVSVDGELRAFTGARLQEDGLYTMDLSVTSVANGLNYVATLTDLGGTSLTSSGSIPGTSASDPLPAVEVGWGLSGSEADGLGSNSIAISSMSVTVPEPSLPLLCLAALVPLLGLRRRRG